MTWIVGTASLFGNSILVSDISVTFTDNYGQQKHVDCLQKIYPLGRFILGGFSGSIKIGFGLLTILSLQLRNIPDDNAWVVDIISHTWLPRLLRRFFKESEESEKALGSQLILASVHPTKNRAASWPWSYVHTFSAPDFEPCKADAREVLAIGKGSKKDVYMEALKKLCSSFDLMQGILMGESGQAQLLAHSINKIVLDSPTEGISTLFQIGLVMKNRYSIHDHEYRTYSKNGEKKEIKFPKIARTYREFETLSKDIIGDFKTALC